MAYCILHIAYCIWHIAYAFKEHSNAAFTNNGGYYLDTSASHLKDIFKNWPDYKYTPGMPAHEYTKSLQRQIDIHTKEGWTAFHRTN